MAGFAQTLGGSLKFARTDRDLTLREAADRFRAATGRPMDASRVRKIEQGRSVDLVDLVGFAIAYQMNVSTLLGDYPETFGDTTLTLTEIRSVLAGEVPDFDHGRFHKYAADRSDRELAGMLAKVVNKPGFDVTLQEFLDWCVKEYGHGPATERDRRADDEIAKSSIPVPPSEVTALKGRMSAYIVLEWKDAHGWE